MIRYLPATLGLCTACAFLLAATAGVRAVEAKPNIIVILTDDLGYGDVGAFGARFIETPHLDRMAAEGAMLTSFYSSANVCTPARAGLLTGRYPVRSGLAVGVIHPHSDYGLPGEEVTIAELLRDAGYRTAMVGKWHLGHVDEAWPTEHGFDAFYGLAYSNDMNPLALYDGREAIEEPVDQRTLTRRYTERAAAFVSADGDAPFFLYFAHTFPHIPLFASEEFEGRSDAGRYGDTVEEIDWSTGEILKALEKAGKLENTLILFTSDNGPWFEGSSGVHRDRKGSTWEGAYRVPLIAYWPGTIPAGTTSDAIAMNIDFLPTLARLVGADLPEGRDIDGRDIWPLFTGDATSPHEALLFFDNDKIAAVRTQDWRLVVRSYYKTYDVPLDRFGYPLLFNMSGHGAEHFNLSHGNPEAMAEMMARLKEAREGLEGLPQKVTPLNLPSE